MRVLLRVVWRTNIDHHVVAVSIRRHVRAVIMEIGDIVFVEARWQIVVSWINRLRVLIEL